MNENSLSVTLKFRAYPEMNAPPPSRRVKWQRLTLTLAAPSIVSAAMRGSAQSPPLGRPCGSKYEYAVSRMINPSMATSRTGCSILPATWKSRVRFVLAKSPTGRPASSCALGSDAFGL